MSHINYDRHAHASQVARNARKIDAPKMRVAPMSFRDFLVCVACVAITCACVVSILPVGL